MQIECVVQAKAILAILGCLTDELLDAGLIDRGQFDARLVAAEEAHAEIGERAVGDLLHIFRSSLLDMRDGPAPRRRRWPTDRLS